MAMSLQHAAQIIARAQTGRKVDNTELNTALSLHGMSREQFDAIKAELCAVKGSRRSARLVPVGKLEELTV